VKHIPEKLSGISKERATKGDYTRLYIAAAEFEEDSTTGVKINAMYSEDYLPLALNLVTNAILHKDTEEKYSLEVINQQLERTPEFTDYISHEPVHAAKKLIIIFGLFVAIGASLLAATYVMMPVEESRIHVKQLQFMTGVNPLVYWGSAFLWDYFVFVLCAAMMVVCLYIFEHYERFTNNHGAGLSIVLVSNYRCTN
jgi:ATP-binding cassette subfamily A (ABC1) protein 3